MQLFRGLVVSGAALFLLASPVFAGEQTPTANSSTQAGASAPPDFMLGRPRVSAGIRGSLFVASANSDIFDFVTDQLLLEKSDFNTGSFGAEIAISVTPRLEIVGAFDMNGVNKNTEDRDEEELLPNGTRVPIQSVTQLEQKNFTASAKFSLMPRGRSVSRLAWIPNTFVPYVGAGAGYGKYDFRQNGDFADFVDHHIFTDSFRSDGWAPTFHVLGGTDIRVARHLLLSLEGKYSWSQADLGQDFIDFEPIDLGGFRFGAGIHFAF
jgi:opacity protein-like surface antigen